MNRTSSPLRSGRGLGSAYRSGRGPWALGLALAIRFSLVHEYGPAAVSAGGSGGTGGAGASGVLLTWFVPPFTTDAPVDVLPIDDSGDVVAPVPAADTGGI